MSGPSGYERSLLIAKGDLRADPTTRRGITRLLKVFVRQGFLDQAPADLRADAVVVRQGVLDAQDLHITDSDLDRYVRAFDHLFTKGPRTCPDLPDE